MATKTYHVMDKVSWAAFVPYFHPQHGSHYINLPSGNILVALSFSSEASEEHFEQNAKRLSLPHPVWDGNQKLSDDHAGELGHLGITTEHTVRDVARIVSAIHPLMKLRVW